MLDSTSITLAAPTQHLRQLTIIRSLLLAFLWAGCIYCASYTTIKIALPALVIAVLTAINLMTLLRLKNSLPVTELEFFVQLLIDVILLVALFYSTGGASNPFISYLLVPVCISAATLPWQFTWFAASLSLAAYTLLLFFNIDFPLFALQQPHQHSRFSWHILGMWFNFFISATLITYFVVKMATTLRRQQETLSQLREDELRNEQLMAVAMLAAGAAHEINTPLSTMTVLLDELRNDHKDNPNLLSDLQVLTQQVSHCAGTLKRLVQDSSAASLGKFSQKTIRYFCESLMDRWQLMRPQVDCKTAYEGGALEESIAFDSRLEQAIINILNNAADANPTNIQVRINASNAYLVWEITDAGAGILPSASAHLGKSRYTTKENGLGLGMIITHATLKTYGGTVTQTPGKHCGTTTVIKIPVQL